MTRNVPVGIDHGTTNSAVAFIEDDKPTVIKPDGADLVMPSAVYFDRRGRKLVGSPAVKAMMTTGPEEGNGFTGYKTGIGQDDRYAFTAARKVLTAPELGAIVIGELLQKYREATEMDTQACVITIPASFEHSACEGTREAARKAGLVYCPLLQEPIAGALAYGFSASQKRAQWLVFDLGGGTLDVSLVIVRDGDPWIPPEGHAGDTRLGGRKFDRDLMAHVLRTMSQTHGYSLENFHTDHPKYGTAWGKLMLAVEAAKIDLSKRQNATVEIEGVLCEDDHGTPVEVEASITRREYEQIIAGDVERAIHACQTLLNRNRLTASQIDRLILIGGPTKTPYLQRMLTERLGIEFDQTVDPMTAVAEGAALYGMTHAIPEHVHSGVASPAHDPGVARVALEYARHSSLPTQWVQGVVEGITALDGALSVEITRTDNLWSSGQVPVDEHGAFTCNLALIERGQPHPSRFTTAVKTASGRVIAQVSEPEIWHPFPGGMKARLANSLRVAVVGNNTARLITAGVELPARGGETFQTTKLLRRGGTDDLLRIPVLEAMTDLLGQEDDHADCNAHVGTLIIAGSDEKVTRDLPEGSEVEVTIEMDESRALRVEAYVPLLDDTFAATFQSEAFNVSLDETIDRFDTLKQRLAECIRLQTQWPSAEAGAALDVIARLEFVQHIEKEIEFARTGERDAVYRAHKSVLSLAATLNKISTMQIEARIEERLGRLKEVVTGEEGAELESIQAARPPASNGSPADLEDVERRINDLDVRVRRRPVFEVFMDVESFPERFRGTEEQLQAFRDAEELIQEIVGQSGGSLDPTPQQVQRALEVHARLMRLWPELPEWRRKKAEEYMLQGGAPREMTDIRRFGSRSV